MRIWSRPEPGEPPPPSLMIPNANRIVVGLGLCKQFIFFFIRNDSCACADGQRKVERKTTMIKLKIYVRFHRASRFAIDVNVSLEDSIHYMAIGMFISNVIKIYILVGSGIPL